MSRRASSPRRGAAMTTSQVRDELGCCIVCIEIQLATRLGTATAL